MNFLRIFYFIKMSFYNFLIHMFLKLTGLP